MDFLALLIALRQTLAAEQATPIEKIPVQSTLGQCIKEVCSLVIQTPQDIEM